jgi:hypothetical protein
MRLIGEEPPRSSLFNRGSWKTYPFFIRVYQVVSYLASISGKRGRSTKFTSCLAGQISRCGARRGNLGPENSQPDTPYSLALADGFQLIFNTKCLRRRAQEFRQQYKLSMQRLAYMHHAR